MSRGPYSGVSTQDSGLIPEWCDWGRGESPILLVAPHGGRRPAVDATAPPPRLRVNDLYTPEVTHLLAARLHAGFIINHGQDRNGLDLNRTSQVRRRAPWFLELLVEQIAHILSRHAHAEVLFIHGWNTGQVKCDIGIGVSAPATELQQCDAAHVTVSDAYRRERIAVLQAACAERQIEAPIGEKYPASHPNNVLQLFTTRHLKGDDPLTQRIAAWVGEGRLDALQLELSIPLRWPGAWRDRFGDAVDVAFGASPRSNVQASPKSNVQSPKPGPTTHDPPTALQFYDPAADVGMFAGIGPTGPQSRGARLLLFLGGQRIALFTGEEMRVHGHVAPLEITVAGAALFLDFRGPILVLEDAAVYLDLEAALSRSRLVGGIVKLHFEGRRCDAAAPVQFGTIEGCVTIDGCERRIDAGAVANAGPLRASGPRQQTMVAAHFGPDRALLSRAVEGQGTPLALHFTDGALRPLDGACLAVTTDGDPYTPARLEFECGDHPPMHGHPLSHMAILRPTGHGGYLRVTFGVARFDWGDQQGYGLYEHARPVRRNSPPAPLLGREG